MIDRIRSRVRPAASQPAIARQRRTSRRDREMQQRRLLYIGTAVVGVLAVLILLGGAAYQYYLFPRQDLASVNGEEIERRDYWKVRNVQLRQQVAQLSQQYQFVSADQQPQLLQRIQEASVELEDVEGADISSDTLATMIDDLVVLQNMEELGISITDDEMEQFIAEQFAPVALGEPTQTPTSEPTAAAWATETSEARIAAATESAAASPTAEGTPSVETTGTPEVTETATDDATETASTTASPEATTTAAAETTGTPDDGTPDPDGSPSAEASPSPSPTETPSADQARSTSEATYRQFDDNFLEPADMSRGDYKRLIVKPTLARQKITEQLSDQVPVRTEQIHAAHILVATSDAANEVVSRLESGEAFEDIAREVSTDTGTAGTGGDLGWFPRGMMVDPFEEAAFSLGVDEVSAPVQSEFGWYIIKVLEKEDDRPIALPTRQQLQSSVFLDWLKIQRDEADIDADIPLPEFDDDPTQQDLFQAPPEAPIPPTATVPPISTIPVEGTGTSGADDSQTPEANETPDATTPDATPTP